MTTTELTALASQALLDRMNGWAVVGTSKKGWQVLVDLRPMLAPTAAELAWQAQVRRPVREPVANVCTLSPGVVALARKLKENSK